MDREWFATIFIGDSDIDPKFLNIQKIYDSLYLDDGKEFKYIGFKEAEKRENFSENCFW